MKAFMALLFILILSSFAVSQATTGSITVRASDASGALIPGVEVTITSPAMIGGSRSAVTDEQGTYRFTELVVGTYRVTFALPGFRTLNVDRNVVQAGRTTTVPAVMEVSASARKSPSAARRRPSTSNRRLSE